MLSRARIRVRYGRPLRRLAVALCLFLAPPAVASAAPLAYDAPPGGSALTLERSGPDLRLVDDATQAIVASGVLADTTRVDVRGADAGDDTLTVDLGGGAFSVPVAFDGMGGFGPPGPPGAQGPPAFRLVAALATAKVKAKRGKSVTLQYVSTVPAQATLDVLKGTKRIAQVRGQAAVGPNRIRWNGKAGRKAAARGTYTLALTLSSVDGQSDTERGKAVIGR
jgi:hypothetical protein